MSLETKAREFLDKTLAMHADRQELFTEAERSAYANIAYNFARPYEDALRELHKNAKDLTDFVTTGEVIPNLNYLKQALSSAEALLEAKNDQD